MAYVDSTTYRELYHGSTIPDGELDSYLQKASDAVDRVTFRRIAVAGMGGLTPFQQGCVKLAVCYQADHMYIHGDVVSPNIQSYSVGGNSVSMGADNDMRYSRQAMDYLKECGLRYRGAL